MKKIFTYTTIQMQESIIAKLINNFKDMYIDTSDDQIISIMRNRLTSLGGNEGFYILTQNEKRSLFIAIAQNALEISLLNLLYTYYESVLSRDKKITRNFMEWVNQLSINPIRKSKNTSKEIWNSDWRKIQSKFPNMIKICEKACIQGRMIKSSLWNSSCGTNTTSNRISKYYISNMLYKIIESSKIRSESIISVDRI